MKVEEIICAGCKNKVFKPLKEIKRRRKKGYTRFYCSRACSEKFNLKPFIKKHQVIEKQCLICSKTFKSSTKKRAAKTCSISCAGKLSFYSLHPEVKERKIGILIKKGFRPKKVTYSLVCRNCNTVFENRNKNRHSCSSHCRSALASQRARANPNCGGETNYKRYKYNGISMDSSWEIELARWLDEQKIKWIRDRKICLFWKDQDGNLRRYYPDFYLPEFNCYLDPKNKYLQQKDKYKLDAIKSQNIKLFDGFLEKIKNEVLILKGCNSIA